MTDKPATPDRDAAQYARSGNLAVRSDLHQKYGRGDWFDWLYPHCGIASGQHILDIGCGPGWFWAENADRLPPGITLTLADLSSGMVAEARSRLASVKAVTTFIPAVADVCALPFRDQSQDRVFAFHMLYHASDPAMALREIARVLTPGGKVVITTNGADNFAPMHEMVSEVMCGNEEGGNEEGGNEVRFGRAFPLEQAATALKARFDQVETHIYDDPLACTSAEDLLAYATSFPPGQNADQTRRAALLDLFERAIAAGGGVLKIPKQVGVFVCG